MLAGKTDHRISADNASADYPDISGPTCSRFGRSARDQPLGLSPEQNLAKRRSACNPGHTFEFAGRFVCYFSWRDQTLALNSRATESCPVSAELPSTSDGCKVAGRV